MVDIRNLVEYIFFEKKIFVVSVNEKQSIKQSIASTGKQENILILLIVKIKLLIVYATWKKV